METTEKAAETRDLGNDDVLAFHFGLFLGMGTRILTGK